MDQLKKYRYELVGLLFLLVIILFQRVNIKENVFKLLQRAKQWSGNQVAIAKIKGTEQAQNHDIWNNLLQQYVLENGNVNYKAWTKKKDSLQLYLTLMATHPPNKATWSKTAQMAYWINVYNAFTIELILAHYPIKSIKDIQGGLAMINSIWDEKFFEIGGVAMDLNTIEHEILRKEFKDPRIHFAINCASFSCPVLQRAAFTEENLERQLQAATIQFFKDQQRNQIEPNIARLSPILSWFAADFTANGTILQFVNQYSAVKIKDNAKVEYLEYDWSLNEE